MEFRVLKESEIDRALFAHFIRRQTVTNAVKERVGSRVMSAPG